MKKIAILASGSGSNAEQIVRHFAKSADIRVAMILTNNPSAGVILRAERLGVPCSVFTREEFRDEQGVLRLLLENGIDFVVLAGFLLLVPPSLVAAFRGRMLNIHPALLPAFGGKGYYGMHVHKAVIASGAIMSGITVHEVNERFDEGDIVFQAACHVASGDTPELLAEKIHALEHKYFPVVIRKFILGESAYSN
ncbi:MAG: phosphoribosylglycinamide formyltransferase [Bacteroidota bacterium]|jgi:phosphoribosylglycinamide formyltransferase-1